MIQPMKINSSIMQELVFPASNPEASLNPYTSRVLSAYGAIHSCKLLLASYGFEARSVSAFVEVT